MTPASGAGSVGVTNCAAAICTLSKAQATGMYSLKSFQQMQCRAHLLLSLHTVLPDLRRPAVCLLTHCHDYHVHVASCP